VHSDDEVRAWFATVVLPSREVWVIDAGGALVALLVLDDGWVDQFYVDPAWTGRGLGSRLVDLAKQRRAALDLWTFEANLGARRFYERHGFVAIEATDDANEEGAPAIRYHWPDPGSRQGQRDDIVPDRRDQDTTQDGTDALVRRSSGEGSGNGEDERQV